jgi:hypothetical protein
VTVEPSPTAVSQVSVAALAEFVTVARNKALAARAESDEAMRDFMRGKI